MSFYVSHCFENIKIKPWIEPFARVIPTGLQILVLRWYGSQLNDEIFFNADEFGTLFTIWDLTYLLIALLLLNKFIIFFHGNLDGSLSRRAPLLIWVNFDLFLCFCNFPWLLLPCGKSSNCISFCLASRRCSLDIKNWSVLLYWCSSSFYPILRLIHSFADELIWVLISSLKVSQVRFTRKRFTI